MSSPHITTREQLHSYLYAALQLEHATIPPYLTALYSIRPGSNADAYHVLRVTAVEEMLHLTLAANILNAVGGTPDLTQPGFVPEYPAYLPDGETDFAVSRGSGPTTMVLSDAVCSRWHTASALACAASRASRSATRRSLSRIWSTRI